MLSLEIMNNKKQSEYISCEKVFSKSFGSPLKKNNPKIIKNYRKKKDLTSKNLRSN